MKIFLSSFAAAWFVLISPTSAVTIDFDSLASGTLVSTQFTGVSFSLSSSPLPAGALPSIFNAGVAAASLPNGLINAPSLTSSNGDLTVAFDSPTNNVSLIYFYENDDIPLTVNHSGGTSIFTLAFDGNVSDLDTLDINTTCPTCLNITSIILGFGTESPVNTDTYVIDNLTFDTPSAVPVPAALPLFGTGLAIMGFIGWRRKRKVAATA